MSRIVKSFNGRGWLQLRSGDVLAGSYHIDVNYHPVRRVHEAKGHFLLDGAPTWDRVVEAEFAREAAIVMSTGVQAEVRLGGIEGGRVTISAAEVPVHAQSVRAERPIN